MRHRNECSRVGCKNRSCRRQESGGKLKISVHHNRIEPTAEDVRAQLEKILANADFGASPQLGRFLRFVVEEALAGRGGALKAYTIGVGVFNRAESFDPQADSIVRVEGSRLRRKLDQYYLGVGRDDPVRIELPKGSYAPCFEQASDDGGEAASGSRVGQDHSPRNRRRWVRNTVVLVAAIAVGIGLFWGWWIIFRNPTAPVIEAQTPPDLSVTMPNGPSIAVLPFKNLSGDQRKDYFGVGLAEQIIADLTRFRDLFVIASDTTEKYAATPGDPVDIGAKLGIHYVLEGSVQKLPAELRVTAALIKVETGHVVWSDDFDRKLNINSVLQLKDDITEKIVIAIAPSYGAMYRDTLNYIKRHETDSFFAYDCVLHAMAHRERGGSKALPEIIECLEKSVATDPHYSKAWAFLSIIYLHEYLVGFDPEMFDFDTEKRGYDAALRAVDEDSQSALGIPPCRPPTSSAKTSSFFAGMAPRRSASIRMTSPSWPTSEPRSPWRASGTSAYR